MTPSNHGRSPLARLALAAGGIGVLVAWAALERYVADSIGGTRGTAVAALLAVCVLAGCGLARSLREWRPKMARPAPARLPERAPADLEPANSLS